MLSLFIGCLFPVKTYFRIAFPVGDPRHGEIHTNLGTFAAEIGTETFKQFSRDVTLCNADNMLCCPRVIFFNNLYKLLTRHAADRTFVRTDIAFNYFAANGTSPLFHFSTLLILSCALAQLNSITFPSLIQPGNAKIQSPLTIIKELYILVRCSLRLSPFQAFPVASFSRQPASVPAWCEAPRSQAHAAIFRKCWSPRSLSDPP